MKSWMWFLPAVAVFLGILLLSTVFSAPRYILGEINLKDKLLHALAYFVLISSLMIGFRKAGWITRTIWWWLVAFAVLYGVLLEWVQLTFFPHRYFEWLDALANTLGVLMGALVFRVRKHE